MKPLSTVLFYSFVILGTITALFVAWHDQPVDASRAPATDDYYKIILDHVTSGEKSNTDAPPKLINAPSMMQLPELPRGCEVTSLAMLLNQAGIAVDKMTLAKEIVKDPTPQKVINGKVHFGDPNVGFVGSLYSYDEPGLGVYHGPIARLAQEYLPGHVKDMTGASFDVVTRELKSGHPVWVIVSSTYQKIPDSEWMNWITKEGMVRVTKKEHSVLLTGYDKGHVYFNDPLSGEKNKPADKQAFIDAWKQFGSQAITYS